MFVGYHTRVRVTKTSRLLTVGRLHDERVRGWCRYEAGDVMTLGMPSPYMPIRCLEHVSRHEYCAARGARAVLLLQGRRTSLADHSRRSIAIRDSIPDRGQHADTRMPTSSTTRRVPAPRARASTAESLMTCFPFCREILGSYVMQRERIDSR